MWYFVINTKIKSVSGTYILRDENKACENSSVNKRSYVHGYLSSIDLFL